MTGTSPFTFQSPSFHSSSYLPKLEANFMRDFSCCGVTLPTLHDLLQHYEEAHATKSPNQGHRPSQGENRAALAAAAIAQQQNQQHGSQGRGLQPDRTLDMQRKLGQNPSPLQHADLDTIDDMELDDALGDGDGSASQMFSSQLHEGGQGGYGNSNQQQLNLGMLPSHQGFSTPSQPGTPIGSGRPLSLQNNPTVSSVNTPTLMANPLQNSQFRNTPDSSGPGTPAEIDESMMGGFGDLSMQNNTMGQNQNQFGRFNGNNNDMVDLCIDEPAKRLFSPSGGMGSPNAHFKLSGAQYGPNSDIARRIREQQLLAGVPDTTVILPNEEPKPFRCPVIGCEKAYKNQNGLKYHKAVSLTWYSPTVVLFYFSNRCFFHSSMAIITNNFMTTPMVRSRSSTQRHQRHTPARLAWRKKSPTVARCAASATRIWTDSSIINRTHHPATRISSLEVVTSPLAVESCKGRTSTLLELASLELAKKAFCEPVNKYVIMSIHNSLVIDANDLDGFRGWEHSCTHTMSWFWIGPGDFGVIAFLFSLFESCSLWLIDWALWCPFAFRSAIW